MYILYLWNKIDVIGVLFHVEGIGPSNEVVDAWLFLTCDFR